MTPSYSTDQKVFVVKTFHPFDGYFFSLERKCYRQFVVRAGPSSGLPNRNAKCLTEVQQDVTGTYPLVSKKLPTRQ
jgi:hypothetical protein